MCVLRYLLYILWAGVMVNLEWLPSDHLANLLFLFLDRTGEKTGWRSSWVLIAMGRLFTVYCCEQNRHVFHVAVWILTLVWSSPHTAGKYLLWCLQHLLALLFWHFYCYFSFYPPHSSCLFLSFLKYVFTKLPPIWLMGWSVSSVGASGNQLGLCACRCVAAHLPPTKTLTASKVG